MSPLLNKIRYNYKYYSELSDPHEKAELEALVNKLLHLEGEIMQYPDVDIMLTTNGNIFFSDPFPKELGDRILKAMAA